MKVKSLAHLVFSYTFPDGEESLIYFQPYSRGILLRKYSMDQFLSISTSNLYDSHSYARVMWWRNSPLWLNLRSGITYAVQSIIESGPRGAHVGSHLGSRSHYLLWCPLSQVAPPILRDGAILKRRYESMLQFFP
jgi:hypothetical protein